jgi:hypothetical protein
MHRAYKAGQPFTSLLSNPQFASLPLADKKEVIAGLRERMKDHKPSVSGMAGNVLKNTIGGAAATIPLASLIPLGIELGSGANKGRVLGALKSLSGNKTVRALVGTGAAIGAAGGLIRSALDILADRRDAAALYSGLADAEEGGEGMATAMFGGVGGRVARSGFSLAPVANVVSGIGLNSAIPAARLGYYDAAHEEVDPTNGVTERVMNKIRSGVPVQADALDHYVKKTEGAMEAGTTMQDILLNSHRDLGYSPESAQHVIDSISANNGAHQSNNENLSQLAQLARDLLNEKRGTH